MVIGVVTVTVCEGARVVGEAAVKIVIVAGTPFKDSDVVGIRVGTTSVVDRSVEVTVAVILRVDRARVFVDKLLELVFEDELRDVVVERGRGCTVFVTTEVTVETEGRTQPQGGMGGFVETDGFLTHFPPFLR